MTGDAVLLKKLYTVKSFQKLLRDRYHIFVKRKLWDDPTSLYDTSAKMKITFRKRMSSDFKFRVFVYPLQDMNVTKSTKYLRTSRYIFLVLWIWIHKNWRKKFDIWINNWLCRWICFSYLYLTWAKHYFF